MGLGTFNHSAYTMQSNFYPTVRATAGVPLDSELDWSKTDWQLWAGSTGSAAAGLGAGIAHPVRDMFINDVHAFLTNAQPVNTEPFSDRYFVAPPDVPGAFDGYRARPVVGGEWSEIALHGVF